MTDITTRLLSMSEAHDEIQRLQQALADVGNPLEYLRRHAEADGHKLNGMAYSVANDLHFVQKIARDALEARPAIRAGALIPSEQKGDADG